MKKHIGGSIHEDLIRSWGKPLWDVTLDDHWAADDHWTVMETVARAIVFS